MKAFDTDWTEIARALPAWLDLSLRARRLALEYLRPSGMHPATPLAPVLEELQLAGFAEPSATGVRVGVPEPMREMVKLMRELDRAPLWENPSESDLLVYLQEHFTTDEVRGLGKPAGFPGWGSAGRAVTAGLSTSANWVEGFLACASKAEAERWERQRRVEDGPLLFHVEEVRVATQQLVRALLSDPAGVPLAGLPERLPGIPPQLLSRALQAGLRYLLVFAGMNEALEPWIGVWPGIVAYLNRPDATPPTPIQVAEHFHAAVLMEDMTSVLVAAAAEPLQLRVSDGAIFARTQQTIAARLITIPSWASPLLEERHSERIRTASAMLQGLGLASANGGGRKREELRLAPTQQGANWLGLSDRERLALLLDGLRNARKQKRDAWGAPVWGFSPVRIGYGDGSELRDPLTEAFLALPTTGFVPLKEFLAYRARIANPLLETADGGRFLHLHGYGRLLRREDAERIWQQVLAAFLAERLIALGGARLGHTDDGRLCVALASPGHYLLGAANEFDYGVAVDAHVIVQPNFEVVFLAPAPKLEAQIGRLAERVGAGPGVMFRLTRPSVLAAAEAGMTPEQVISTLEAASSQPLSDNVVRQLRDWFGEVRRVRLRSALLIDCPDAETAARVLTAAGKQVRSLTPTLLEVSTSIRQSRAALLRQLRAGGVFVED